MLVALGFLAASLLGLLVASAFWSRAVRLTTARIKQSMPVSEPEIKADRDRLRAEYAIKVHKLEMELEQAKLARARQIIDINRRDASIATLESSVRELTADLEENQNARRVLEQTVADRLPRVEARLAEAKRVLFNRDREIAELAATAKRNKQALEEVSSINAQKNAQIERLTTTLTTKGGRGSGASADSEVALRAEIEMLRSKASEQALLIDRLQRRLGHGHALTGPAKPATAAPAEGSTERVRKDISDAEAALDQARSASAEAASGSAAFEREIRALTAKTEDQAGEIARLKAALATFEQESRPAGLKDSKIALKARLGSAQAQADQQAATIAKLRAELAATHERLAKQAAHFMGEMRRIGGGSTGGQSRRPMPSEERRNLIDRVAQVRSSTPVPRALPRPALPDPVDDEPESTANGRNGNGNGNGNGGSPEAAAPHPVAPGLSEAKSENPAAPEMPQPGEIPEKRRRSRLLDRITGAAKG
jgi:hypothetical protein